MKQFLLLIMALTITVVAQATNSTRKVTQVTESMTLSADEDLVITGTEPFGANGSVDITNTEHGVLILQDVKPSLVLKNWLSGHVYVNGQQAKDSVNCQVKMYARGTIIMPYAADIRPLTVYTEKNFTGDSSSDFGLGNTGGYMNSLTDEGMNNRIHSFRLKRGYMVTFSTGLSGWGYSRCFIADTEDLEVAELPAVLAGRISSYRIFRWLDAGKKSLASNINADDNARLGSTSCYHWGTSIDMLPDFDCVANHIYEDWPSSAKIGMATATCHTKNNNEPGNRSDDTPQDVATVLANWQNMMRTGLRLGSETSHDGSWSHLRAFIDSIDARGWRCDFLDLHCYWNYGFAESNMKNYYNNYGKRPIWISEWVWGASWNNNGIFATDRTFSKENQQKNLNRLKEILPALESSPYVERYYYWNSEAACSRLIYNDTLSLAGEYYAQYESNIAYRKTYEKVPNVVYRAPQSLTGDTKEIAVGICHLSWTELNGDMIDEIRIQRKKEGDANFETIATIKPTDQTSASLTLSYTDKITEPGTYTYRIADLTPSNSEVYSGQISITYRSVTLATEEEITALNDAITAAEKYTLGFNKGEYAPYNNVQIITELNAAKALADATYLAADDVTAATTALTNATWTANETALDAVYDGTFAQKTVYTTSGDCKSEMLEEGWTTSGDGYRLILDDTTEYPALSQTEAQRALFFWNGSYKYGETDGYTMPLAAYSIYALTFKYAGWSSGQVGSFKVSVLNSSNEGLATVDAGTSNKGPQNAGVFKSKIYTFTTGNTASDYLLNIVTSGNSSVADVHIFNTYVRKATTSGYGTICLPYSVTPASNVTVYEIAGVDNIENPTTLYLKAVTSMELGKPYIYYAAENGTPVAAEFKLKATDLATTPATGANNLTGIFSSQAGSVANDSYILRDEKWYKVDNSSEFNLGNNRAYISSFSGMTVLTDQQGVKAMSIVNPDATAISNIQDSTNEVGSQTIYTLSGQRVSHVSKSGIYIANGKKVFIK